MKIQTKYFGEIELGDEKIITFDNGLMGFEEYKQYTILYDIEDGEEPVIAWLQCTTEEGLALPVIHPTLIKEDYDPMVEDELLKPLGELTEENLVIFLTVTVPSDVKKMSANLKAPIIINSDTRKGCQIIAENDDYPVKFSMYKATKESKNEEGK